MCTNLGIVLKKEELEWQDSHPKKLLKAIMQKWMPAAESLLEMIVAHLPSPNIVALTRVDNSLFIILRARPVPDNQRTVRLAFITLTYSKLNFAFVINRKVDITDVFEKNASKLSQRPTTPRLP